MTGAAEQRTPRVLLLYYSYTGQSKKVLDAAAEVLRARGCDVTEAPVEFTDPRYAERFSRFPMRSVWPEFLGMLPAQTLKRTGDIRTPDAVRTGDYDLICIGSPTWWDTVSMPLRSFLMSHEARPLLDGKRFAVFVVCRRKWRKNLRDVRKLAEKKGGRYVDGIHFTYPGGELSSMLSLTSYLGTGEYKQRWHGLTLPPTNINDEHLEESRRFAARVADKVFGKQGT